ncbi:hypothetical protein OEV82_16040 [Caldibacillus thermolactis]|jgi:hypothetical protein|uniref:Uncharacterized protein n=1 Tax=Pallidibacillus thermolactis TaxID=251051 RepID=A0ABT2WJP0_9BACI|nr:hypothetical protein [Pallidibacillus thermolactis]MCU9595908.1 hypothetical protein [Pallidibacillus thermolactis]MCU9602187.1 hypothetical protein [Pallidibacillus thermolactis subsp. kokeshiiformis]MED1674922.1 hypothetical protein [Pallidibacillus thermolactis subsp. kokeshiiformis]
MLGLMINEKEAEELIYMLKREMDELLMDFADERINVVVKYAMEERYHLLFSLFKRIAPPNECIPYIRKSKFNNNNLEIN